MFRFSTYNITTFLVISGILIAPLLSIGEISALLLGAIASQAEALTSVYIKVLKDVIFVLLLVLGGFGILRSRRIYANRYFWLFMAFVAMSFMFSISSDPLFLIAGLRWILPVLTIMTLYKYVDLHMQKRIAVAIICVFIIGLILQIFELFFISTWYGNNMLGLSARNPGFYLIPSSMAMFSMLTWFYAYYFCDNRSVRRCVVYLLCPLSIILTASGTGILTLGACYMLIFYTRIKQKVIIFFICIFLLAIFIMCLPTLSGRHNIFESMLIRIDILKSVSIDKAIVSRDFGGATNTGILLKGNSTSIFESNSIIADSTLVSLAHNTGIISLLLFVLFVLNKFKKSMIYYHFAIIYFLFMLTTIVFELFPANLLLIVNVAFFGREQYA